jgi:hypothetical protein
MIAQKSFHKKIVCSASSRLLSVTEWIGIGLGLIVDMRYFERVVSLLKSASTPKNWTSNLQDIFASWTKVRQQIIPEHSWKQSELPCTGRRSSDLRNLIKAHAMENGSHLSRDCDPRHWIRLFMIIIENVRESDTSAHVRTSWLWRR